MSWSQSGKSFYLRDGGSDVEVLPPHVYTVSVAPMVGMHLVHQQKCFEFPYKLYNEDTFPERVHITFRETSGNLGILMTGIKGTGKTVQAEQICNLLKIPVILVTNDFEGNLVPFLNSIPKDIVVFVDEYEKIYERSDAMLSIMDGALRTSYRRVFVLTSNSAYISDSMLNRPGRILYVKSFGNLSGATVVEIIDDMLKSGDHRQAVINFIKGLEIITIDIVKAICAEVNRFNEPPSAFKHLLNIRARGLTKKQNIYHLLGGKKTLLKDWARTDPTNPLQQSAIDDTFGVLNEETQSWDWYGDIKSVDESTQTIVTTEGTFILEIAETHPSFAGMAF